MPILSRALLSRALGTIVCILLTRPLAAQSAVCAFPGHYPGDGAAPSAIAAWMAGLAETNGLPRELPVMAALTLSGLQNIGGDADSVGFFQMRTGIWDQGKYAGYADKPELQVAWFIDHATAAINRAKLGATRGFVEGPDGYGRWIADALSLERDRARFLARLGEARALIDNGRLGVVSWPYEGGYPGDDAAKETLAAWMATRARAAGLPGELPIMAALVESGLQNLRFGDEDRAGFFGMRLSVWNVRAYFGFADHPELQVKWFIDQAHAVREFRIGTGDPFFADDPGRYGDWIADVERPAEQFRGRYQLRLAEARALMVAGCASARR